MLLIKRTAPARQKERVRSHCIPVLQPSISNCDGKFYNCPLPAEVWRLVAVPTSDDALLNCPAGQVGICTRQELGGQHADHGCQSSFVFGSVC